MGHPHIVLLTWHRTWTREALSDPTTSFPPSTANAVEETVNPAATAVGPMTDSLPTEASQKGTELFFTKHHEEIKMLIELRDAYVLWAKRLSAASSKIPEEFKQAHTELGVVYTQLLRPSYKGLYLNSQ
ncbi:hypothetical protein NPIL_141081 [Nephila pilipes]|uniref:Uncharacterized protein n=1 Tax=Nephila pilipes TaxID=299642 RepID=A0A8X6N079_NEPPI|nr:hypothetical protein NPIL_141081 [Nephila pilipes]